MLIVFFFWIPIGGLNCLKYLSCSSMHFLYSYFIHSTCDGCWPSLRSKSLMKLSQIVTCPCHLRVLVPTSLSNTSQPLMTPVTMQVLWKLLQQISNFISDKMGLTLSPCLSSIEKRERHYFTQQYERKLGHFVDLTYVWINMWTLSKLKLLKPVLHFWIGQWQVDYSAVYFVLLCILLWTR